MNNFSNFSEKPTSEADKTMVQMYGTSSKFGDYKEKNKKPKQKKIQKQKLELPEKIEIEHVGYILLSIVMILQSILFTFNGDIGNAIGGIILAIISIIIPLTIRFVYNDNINYYLANATVTLKSLFLNLEITSGLMKLSTKIFFASVGAVAIQQLILRHFLFLPLSNMIYSFGYYGMLFSSLLCFANRETNELHKGFSIYSSCAFLLILENGFIAQYKFINYHLVISLMIFWTLSCLFKKCVIEDIQKKTKVTTKAENVNDNKIVISVDNEDII
ncbi:MAG: hypothetical protein K0R54_787 [Clostridiaceae bacterium]|jgi:hypothetical protein|nr:hypothetical protein [Clostridiaceae bacterium]